MPTWATGIKEQIPRPAHLGSGPKHAVQITLVCTARCSPTIRRARDLNKSRQASSDAATSSRGTDAGVGQGVSGKTTGCRSWHHRVSRGTRAHVGVSSIWFHWWVHVCCIWECKDPNKIRNRPMNYIKFDELATEWSNLPDGEPTECFVNEELLCRSACIHGSEVRKETTKATMTLS